MSKSLNYEEVTWVKKTQAVRDGLGYALPRSCMMAWVLLSLFVCFFFLPSLGSSLICSGLFFDIYKG